MRTQEDIQRDMTGVIRELSQRKIINPNALFEDVLKEYPDIKSKWDVLLKEAEEIRSKGLWLFS